MLTLQQIKSNPAEVVARLAVKGFDGKEAIDRVLALDDRRRQLQLDNDNKAAELNRLSASIGALMKQGKRDEAEQAKQEVALLKESQRGIAQQLAETEQEQHDLLITIPNMPCAMVPAGTSAADNVVEKTGGPMPELGEDALPHWELAKKYNLIDFDLGVKITGAGFPVYMGKGARLQRALIQFFLDRANDAGYLEIEPPYVVNEASAYGTGQLPDKEGQMYHCQLDNLYLIPTAEVPVTNIYRDVILSEEELNRLHQFDKVEIVRVERPEDSYAALEDMKDYVQGLLDSLGLPWHILRLCGGDMSFTSAITFDFEVWSGAQQRWLEVSSVSNFETYQANRLKCRYRGADKKTRLCHTLNGSALALPRIMAALLENNQTSEGIVVPECLRKYTGFDIIN